MNLSRIILYGALFFGTKAVLKKQPGTPSAPNGTGKTNDPYTPEELAELKKAFCTVDKSPHLKPVILNSKEQYIYEELKKRNNNLFSFCECRNIAKQTETELKGLEGKSGYRWKKQMSGKEVIAMLKKNGWEHVKTKGGSHQKFVKNEKSIIIPVHGNKPLKIGTYNAIKEKVSEVEKK
ncbi:MAG: type II toxin-antitoxin system HicA family toxin [Bacteroidales bacterium]|nr:type II toxin-antitoxin system HicA family toxin [Bacteroidales bacterium]